MTFWDTIKLIGEIATVVVLGGFSVVSIWGKNARAKRQELSQASQDLVTMLQGTVTELKGKVEELTDLNKKNTVEITRLTTENDIIKTILEGKDQRGEEIYSMVKGTFENTSKLFELMNKHMTLTEKMVDKMPRISDSV